MIYLRRQKIAAKKISWKDSSAAAKLENFACLLYLHVRLKIRKNVVQELAEFRNGLLRMGSQYIFHLRAGPGLPVLLPINKVQNELNFTTSILIYYIT